MKNTLYTNPEAPGIYAKNPFTINGDVVSIQLTQGKTALVDLADLPLVAAHRWHADKGRHNVYAKTNIPISDGKYEGLKLHRLLQETTPEHPCADHKNGNGLDNRRENLRPSSSSENCQNRRLQGGSSNYKGVHRIAKRNKWRGQIRVEGNLKHLGYFASELDAAQAYDVAAREYFGDFAALNFPQ